MNIMGNLSWSLDLAVLVLQDARRRHIGECFMRNCKINPSWARKFWTFLKVVLTILKILDFVRRLAGDYLEKKHALQL